MKFRVGIFIGVFVLSLFSANLFAKSCRETIPSLICEVAAPIKEPDRYKDNRTCLPLDTSKYQKLILQAFSAYPKFVQDQFCSLKKIYIEQEFFGPAWSTPVDENNPSEILIGLRKKDLDAQVDLQDYGSWFEQQSFGGLQDFKVQPDLPIIMIAPKTIASKPFLLFTFLHELGHSFDYQKHYNRSKDDPKFAGSWTSLQWSDINQIQHQFDFKERKSICLNNCNGTYLAPLKASLLYRDLFSHGFVSQLSATNAMEDFADSFAYYVMSNYMGAQFVVVANKQNFPVSDFINGRAFKKKLIYLQEQFPRP